MIKTVKRGFERYKSELRHLTKYQQTGGNYRGKPHIIGIEYMVGKLEGMVYALGLTKEEWLAAEKETCFKPPSLEE